MSDPTTPADRKEWKRLDDEATPAPWDGVISSYAVRYLGPTIKNLEHGDHVCQTLESIHNSMNQKLIAEMRNNFRRLIADVERLEAVIGAIFIQVLDDGQWMVSDPVENNYGTGEDLHAALRDYKKSRVFRNEMMRRPFEEEAKK